MCSGIHAQTELDTLSGVQLSDTSFVMQKSPWGAVLRSALIPGFGQVYNESYWKAPVIWGFIGYFTYGWISNNDLYKKYRDRYSSSLANSDLSLREFYKDSRDLYTIYMLLTYFLNLIDAYVDAHMFDFSVEENLVGNIPELRIRFFF